MTHRGVTEQQAMYQSPGREGVCWSRWRLGDVATLDRRHQEFPDGLGFNALCLPGEFCAASVRWLELAQDPARIAFHLFRFASQN